MVAKRYNLNANQFFRWRRLFREPERAGGADRFVPVVVEAAPSQEPDAATIPCVDAPVDASIFRTAWYMRSGAVVCPASPLRRFTGHRAFYEATDVKQ